MIYLFPLAPWSATGRAAAVDRYAVGNNVMANDFNYVGDHPPKTWFVVGHINGAVIPTCGLAFVDSPVPDDADEDGVCRCGCGMRAITRFTAESETPWARDKRDGSESDVNCTEWPEDVG